MTAPGFGSEFASELREQVISRSPFTVRRVARWSECDPAGVVFTGNFCEYMLSAVHLFRRHVFRRDLDGVRAEHAVDLPAKALSLVFRGSLWPNDLFDMVVSVGGIRRRTFDIIINAARSETGEPVFDGSLSVICVSAENRKLSVLLPPDLRQCLSSEADQKPTS